MSKPFLKYLASGVFFGTNGIIAAGIALASHEIVLLRALLGAVLLVAIFVITRKTLDSLTYRKELPFLLLSGVAMAGGWLCLFEAFRQIGVSLASLLYYCGPVIVMALAPVMYGERLTAAKLGGFAVVIVGVLLVNGVALDSGVSAFGLAIGACSAVCYAVMVLFNKKAVHIQGLENSMIQLVVAFVVVSIYTVVRQGFSLEVPFEAWPAILFLGLVNTGFACYLYFSSIVQLPAQTVAVFGYVELLSAVVLSVIILTEPMTALQMLGAACILGGAIFSELSGLREKGTAAGKTQSSF